MISIKNLKSSEGSGLPKVIAPGNVVCKINSIKLETPSYDTSASFLVMNVETEPIENFEGFYIDKNNPDAGRHLGQVGKVKTNEYAYKDGTTKTGIKIQRDRSILIFLQSLCKTLGVNEWFTEQDGKHDTIEDFVDAFNASAPIKDKYLEFCVAGREYEGKTGYTNYDMWLPKAEGKKYAFGAEADGVVIKYDEAKHLKKLEVKEVKSFGDDEDVFLTPKTSSDFSLD